MHEYKGVIHIHSKYSDGTGDVPSIARAASEVGLDFFMLTDHNNLKAKKEGWEKTVDGVMVLVGYEINDRQDRNHYLAFGLDSTVGTRISAEEYVRRVRERGGIGFLAHPDEKRQSMPEHPSFPWTAWNAEDFDGIEIWNHMSEWMEGLTSENKIQRFLHPLKSIVAPPAETLRRWDACCRKRPVTGIGGVDAHAHKADVYGFFDVEVFPYKVMFRSIRTHVLLEQALHPRDPDRFEADKWRIYDALRAGRCFVANAYHADASGFEYYALAGRKRHHQGETLHFRKDAYRLVARTPARARLRLVWNGNTIEEFSDAGEFTYKISTPGIYRVEAWIGHKGWIFSNHIRFADDDGNC